MKTNAGNMKSLIKWKDKEILLMSFIGILTLTVVYRNGAVLCFEELIVDSAYVSPL